MKCRQRLPVTFLLPSMEGGGAEKLTLSLVTGFLDRGYAVDLVLTRNGGELLPMVPAAVHIEHLNLKHHRNAIGPLRSYIRRHRPQAIIAAMWPLPVITILACMGLRHRPRVILSEHIYLPAQYGGDWKVWGALRFSIGTLYRFADGLVGVSKGVSKNLARLAGVSSKKVSTIYNPIPKPNDRWWDEEYTDRLWGGPRRPRIITVGALKDQKNQSLLLEAFAMVQQKTGAKLAILGSGPLNAALQRQIKDLHLEEHAILPGFVTDPDPWYASADVFVLSSDYEGFGNVIVEAMHFGLPIVSTDCPSGPKEILEGGRYGTLVSVGDTAALAQAIEEALTNPLPARLLCARADFFSIDRAVSGYEALVTGAESLPLR